MCLGRVMLTGRTGDRKVPGSTLGPVHCWVTTLGKLFTHAHVSVTKWYNLVTVKGGDALRLGR